MILYAFCGIPGSGKSTMAIRLANGQNARLYSYDVVRRKSKLSSFDDICALVYQHINDDLLNGYDVVYDAPHVTLNDRKNLLEIVSHISCMKVLMVMTTSLEECLRRNENREAKLPNRAIHDFYNNFEPPILDEGWDEIIYVKEDGSYECDSTSD